MAILSSEEQEKITHAVSLAENRTSGEIRIVVENIVGDTDAYTKATQYFVKLGMHKTAARNGVLIYLAVADHQFAIIGDQGINERVGTDFWESTKEKMLAYFREGDYTKGLVEGILQAGERLRKHFPRLDDDINELPNEVFFGKN